MEIINTFMDSLKYANEALFGKWVRWIILIISSIIFPLIMGYSLRIMKGTNPAPEPDNYLGMFIDGIKVLIIEFVYLLIPIIIGAIIFIGGFGGGALLSDGSESSSLLVLVASFGLAFVVFIILALIVSFISTIGVVSFARTGKMGDAFAFSKIFEIIGKIGWLKYILAIIFIWIVLSVICSVINMIPVISILIMVIVSPYLSILAARFYSELYDAGN